MSDVVKRTFVIFVEDRPGVLNRVTSLFRRRDFNIESLTVSESHEPGVSRITVVCLANEDTAKRIEANVYKLVNVLEVDEITHKPRIERCLALIKVRADRAARAELIQLCEMFRASVVDVAPESLTIEAVGAPGKIQGLLTVLEPFGIEEMVQSGAIAMTRGSVPKAERRRPVREIQVA
ncbi:MAG: acetolactate synthase small subunit [Myxococcales bacterium]|nr:acetolactate synthase small subunit [Myxococcales bacterium]MCB9732759.1 acetolactate synthase small subunit [Deltaproteobacteria bacterium]